MDKCLNEWEQHVEGSEARARMAGGGKERIQSDGARGAVCVGERSGGEEPQQSGLGTWAFFVGNGEPWSVLSREGLAQICM